LNYGRPSAAWFERSENHEANGTAVSKRGLASSSNPRRSTTIFFAEGWANRAHPSVCSRAAEPPVRMVRGTSGPSLPKTWVKKAAFAGLRPAAAVEPRACGARTVSAGDGCFIWG